MISHNCIPAFFQIKKSRPVLLVLCWLIGSALGIWMFQLQRVHFTSLMRGAFESPVSIVGLLLIVFLPLSITVIAVIYSKPFILYLLCLAKSAAYCLNVCAIYYLYRNAGWLVHGLLLVLDNLSIVVLWTMWCRGELFLKNQLPMKLAFCFALCTAVWILDYYVISRFAVLVLC